MKINKKKLASRILLYSFLAFSCFFVFQNFYDQGNETHNEINTLKKDTFNLQYSSGRSAKIPPSQFLKIVEKSMYIMPDMRLINALMNLRYSLDPAAASSEAQLGFQDGSWKITGDGEDINIPFNYSLSEYYEQSDTMLSKLDSLRKFSVEVKELTPELKILANEVESFDPYRAIQALKSLNKIYAKDPNISTYQIITKASIIIALHTTDYFLDNIRIEAKSLSMLTVLKKYKPKGIEEEEALIAYMLGYTGQLETAVKKLGSNAGGFEFVISKDLKGFETYILDSKRSTRDVYLFIQELAKNVGADSLIEYNLDALYAKYGHEIIPTVSKLLLKKATFNLGFRVTLDHINYLYLTTKDNSEWYKKFNSQFKELGFSVSAWLMKLLMNFKDSEIARSTITYLSNHTLTHSYMFNKLEDIIQTNKNDYKNMIIDEEYYESFYHNIMYNLMAKIGNQYAKVFGNKDSTAHFITELNNYQTPYSKLYQKYLEATYEVIFGNPPNYQLLDRLAKYHDIALYRLYDLYKLYNDRLGLHNPQLPIISMLINRKIDNRPSFAEISSDINNRYIYNIENFTNAVRAQVKFNPNGNILKAYLLKYMDSGEIDIDKILEDKRLTSNETFYFFKGFKELLPKEQWKKITLTKMQTDQQDNYALFEYASLLEEENKLIEARDLLIKQSVYFKSSNDLNYSNIMGKAAELSLKLNLPELANEQAEPAFNSYSGYGLHLKAKILTELGKYDEAVQIINKAIERYPQANHYEQLSELYLLQGKQDEIVKILHKVYIPEKNNLNFYQLGEIINRVSEKKKDFVLKNFFDLLLTDERFLREFPQTMYAFSKLKRYDEAIHFLKLYIPKNLKFNHETLSYRYTDNWTVFIKEEKFIRYLINSFASFNEAKQFREGAKFIFENAGPNGMPYLFIGATDLDNEAKAELFNYIKDKKDINSQFAALHYVDYFITEAPYDEKLRETLNDYFSDPTINNFYYKMGQFLLTGQGHAAAEELSMKESRQISLYYFTGKYYDSINDIKTANKWYQAGTFEGFYSYESRWNSEYLNKMKNLTRSIPGLLRLRKEKYHKKSLEEGRDYSIAIKQIDVELAKYENKL